MYGEHLPHFNPNKVTQKMITPIFQALFEIRFKNKVFETEYPTLTEEVYEYQLLSPIESSKRLIRVDFNLNRETLAKLKNEIKNVLDLEIIHHDKNGKAYYQLHLSHLSLERMVLQGSYASTQLQQLSVYWEYQETEWLTRED